MSKQKFMIEIKRTVDGFEGIADGKQLDFDKISKIVEAVQEDLEKSLAVNQNLTDRRKFIAYNDTLKGTDAYLGSSKLGKKFGVSTGTIMNDRDMIEKKGIVGEAPQDEPVKELEPEAQKDETVSEPSAELEKTTGKKSKNAKGKKGKKWRSSSLFLTFLF